MTATETKPVIPAAKTTKTRKPRASKFSPEIQRRHDEIKELRIVERLCRDLHLLTEFGVDQVFERLKAHSDTFDRTAPETP
jgi:hypothetical protein